MSGSDTPSPGHNGGPPLEEPTAIVSGRCKHCRHWHAPPEGEQQRAYEAFRIGLSRRCVKRPTGSRDCVLFGLRCTPTFRRLRPSSAAAISQPSLPLRRRQAEASSPSGRMTGSLGRGRKKRFHPASSNRISICRNPSSGDPVATQSQICAFLHLRLGGSAAFQRKRCAEFS
jgi:hypothetical protein